MKDKQNKTARREFLGSLAAGAATLGIAALSPLTSSAANELPDATLGADEWFEQLKGKHRMVFDVPKPHGTMPFAWPRVFLNTNVKTGTPIKDLGVVVVLRHEAIPYAMEDRLWEKYKLGEAFKIDDTQTKAPSVRNPFWKPKPDDYKIPGVGNAEIGINELQASGVMFCVCDMALTVNSFRLAKDIDPAVVKQDFLSGLLPGIQVVPSGVWALGRAQEKKCAYVFAG